MPPVDKSRLWQIGNKYYDLSQFAAVHPGGRLLLHITRGTDCTIPFASTHLYPQLPAARLREFYAGEDSVEATNTPVQGGFYQVLRERVQAFIREKAGHAARKNEKALLHGSPAFNAAMIFLFGLLQFLNFLIIVKGKLWALVFIFPVVLILGGWAHDALHQGPFMKSWKNRLVAFLVMDVQGISSYIYSVIHIRYHHVITNIRNTDPDIMVHYPLVRLQNSQEWKWHHRFQVFSQTVSYYLTFWGVGILDIFALITGSWGPGVPVPRPYRRELLIFIAGKMLWLSLYLVAPIYFLGFAEGILVHLLILGIPSFFIGLGFALNHQNSRVEDFDQATLAPGIDAWAERQARSTAGYQNKNAFFIALFAGLGVHLEHHLFPGISYSRLKEIAPIVEKTCKDFGIPYHYYKTYWQIVHDHYKYLLEMGHRKEGVIMESSKYPV